MVSNNTEAFLCLSIRCFLDFQDLVQLVTKSETNASKTVMQDRPVPARPQPSLAKQGERLNSYCRGLGA
jgi:hypothetical protein